MISKQIERLIAVAMDDVGYLEKATNDNLYDKTANAGFNNWTKYGEWYPQNGYAWCAMAVSYWVYTASISFEIVPKFKSVGDGVRWFKERGRWHDRKGYNPQIGDIIFYAWDGVTPAHVGIVRAVDSDKVYTVEGNTSGGSTLIDNGGSVAAKSYMLTYGNILGYGNPLYLVEDSDMDIKEIHNSLTTLDGTGKAPSLWAKQAVERFITEGLFNGDGQGNYGCQQLMTREAVVQLLYNFAMKFMTL
jgi:hypothetical protein